MTNAVVEYELDVVDELNEENAKESGFAELQDSKLGNFMVVRGLTRREVKKRAGQDIIEAYDFTDLDDGTYLTPFANPFIHERKQRIVNLVVGRSGSGKSWYMGDYARSYRANYPDNDIYIFSNIQTYDEAYDGVSGMYKIPLDFDFLDLQSTIGTEEESDEAFKVDDFSDSLVIFDDIDVIPNKDIREEVKKIRASCLEEGRHARIDMCAGIHELRPGLKGQMLFTEANYITIYPKFNKKVKIRDFIKNDMGFDLSETKRIMNLPSRWITFHQGAPDFFFHELGAEIY